MIDPSADKSTRKLFHWALEFPEVFENIGFDGIVGNPPFMGGKKISGHFSSEYRTFLLKHLAANRKSSADLCAYFLLRMLMLVKNSGKVLKPVAGQKTEGCGCMGFKEGRHVPY
jgi:hypothetical protein